MRTSPRGRRGGALASLSNRAHILPTFSISLLYSPSSSCLGSLGSHSWLLSHGGDGRTQVCLCVPARCKGRDCGGACWPASGPVLLESAEGRLEFTGVSACVWRIRWTSRPRTSPGRQKGHERTQVTCGPTQSTSAGPRQRQTATCSDAHVRGFVLGQGPGAGRVPRVWFGLPGGQGAEARALLCPPRG